MWRIYPKASAVTAQAIIAVDAAAARLSFLQTLIWFPPRNLDTAPVTPANMAKVKKKGVAEFPPKPASFVDDIFNAIQLDKGGMEAST